VHEAIWACNPFINNAPLSVPLHLDAVWRAKGRPFFDGAFFIESATEWETDSEQPNVYDRLYSLVGLDPARIPIKFKRPVFMLSTEDIDKRAEWLKALGSLCKADLSRYIVLQLRTANKVRSLPLATAQIVLAAINEAAAKTNTWALVTDDKPLVPELVEAISRLPRLINVAGKVGTIRMFGSLIGGAALVLGPDSSALHFAAASETPAIGIWGPFDPQARVKYYPNQTHLWHPEKCPACPCYNYLPELPIQKCPQGPKQQSCEVFDGISFEEVYSAVLDRLQ
jgi:ADP-heptose:LPS heptosyltransferase